MANWVSYDPVAASYEELHSPVFSRLARELVREAERQTPVNRRILDVGTGTGIAAQAAKDLFPGAFVLGVDLSAEMLKEAYTLRPALAFVVADVFDLPVLSESLDVVVANCVLSHLENAGAGLVEILRVLKPGGSLVASAWGAKDEEAKRLWSEIAEEWASRGLLEKARLSGVPSERAFSNPGHFSEILQACGLASIQIQIRHYDFETTLENYVAGRESTFVGRLMQKSLSEKEWTAFQKETRRSIKERFGDRLVYTREVLFASARKRGNPGK